MTLKDSPKLLEIGKAEVVRDFTHNRGHKVTFLALGNMQSIARKAADQLAAEGFDCAIVNPRFTKPIDEELTARFAGISEVVVTLEDHVLMGGYGSSVLELLSEKRIQVPVVRIGWPDLFIEHASSVDHLRHKYGLTAENTVAKVKAQFNAAPIRAEKEAPAPSTSKKIGEGAA